MVRGLVRADEWLSHEENREEALQIWPIGTPYAALKEEFAGLSLKHAFNPLIDDFLIEQYRDADQFSKDEKLIRSDIDLQQWFEPKYLDTALKSLGLERYWPRRTADGAAVDLTSQSRSVRKVPCHNHEQIAPVSLRDQLTSRPTCW